MRVARSLGRHLVAVVFAAATACASPSATTDEGDEDPCSSNLPPSSAACLEGQCGNAIGVGQQCTGGGGECSDWSIDGEAWLCTADADDTPMWFCTRPCGSADDCGDGAVCQGDPEDPGGPKGCVPNACADPPVE